MLTPDLYRYITLKKEPVIFFMSRFAPTPEAQDQIALVGQTFFNEFGAATFRSVYATVGDICFYRSASNTINREAIVTSRNWTKNKDLSDCSRLIFAEDLSKEHIEELFMQVQLDAIKTNREYFVERLINYCVSPVEEKIETDGIIMAELISVFGSEIFNIKPADLVVLYLSEMKATDILWMNQLVKKGIRTLILSV